MCISYNSTTLPSRFEVDNPRQVDTGKAALPACGRYEDPYLGFCSELRLQGHFPDIVRLCGDGVFVNLLWSTSMLSHAIPEGLAVKSFELQHET